MMNSIGKFYADVVLNHLLRHTLSVVRHSLQADALTEVLPDEHDAPPLLFLVPEG